jgi:hypothetical protein
MAKDKTFLSRIKQFFNFDVDTTNKDNEIIVPDSLKDQDRKVRNILNRSNTPMENPLSSFWNWWLENNYDNSETLRAREDRQKNLDLMVKNEAVISMAADLYADEASQIDSQSNIIGVESQNPKVSKKINELLKEWGVDQEFVRSACYDIALFGEAFILRPTSGEKGITDFQLKDGTLFLNRIEFNAEDVFKNEKSLKSITSKEFKLKALASIIKDTNKVDDSSNIFKKFLFGFELAGQIFLPPWNVGHARRYTTQDGIHPWGLSLFLNSLATWKKLAASENLVAMARYSQYPREIFSVKNTEDQNQDEVWDIVQEASEQFNNVGNINQNPDDPSLNTRIWVPEGLISYQQFNSNVNVGDIADLEFMRDDLIMQTRIPKGYLITDRGAFGVSGQSLLQQSKPFGRAVFSIQSSLLKVITESIRIHFLLTGEFQKDETEFTLSMNFPVTEESREKTSAKSDSLRLASDIINNIQQAIGTRDGLPADVVKDVFSKISFLDPEDVDEWINSSSEVSDDDKDDDSGSFFSSTILNKNQINSFSEDKKNHYKEIISRINDNIIKSSLYESFRKNNITEGVSNQRHYYNSSTTISKKDSLMYKALLKKEIQVKG